MSEFATFPAPAEVRFERLLPGPIETIWAYLTDSKKRGEWLAAGPMDLRVGGEAKLRFQNTNLSPHKAPAPEKYKNVHEFTVVVTQCDPPRLLSLTWPESSEVTFELMPRGDKVLLVVLHRRLTDRAVIVKVSGGWHTHLDFLAERLDDRVPSAFWPAFSAVVERYEKQIPH
jgi:uncharacterized protein YndB with AHSA1/START domain